MTTNWTDFKKAINEIDDTTSHDTVAYPPEVFFEVEIEGKIYIVEFKDIEINYLSNCACFGGAIINLGSVKATGVQ